MKAEKVEENNEACGPVQTRPESLHCLGLVRAELHIGLLSFIIIVVVIVVLVVIIFMKVFLV